MAIREEYKSVGVRSMPDPFPLGDMKVSSRKRGEFAPNLQLHFQTKRNDCAMTDAPLASNGLSNKLQGDPLGG